MKLLRYGPAGAEKPGLLDSEGTIRDLSAHVSDIDGAALAHRVEQLVRAQLARAQQPGQLDRVVAAQGIVAEGVNGSTHWPVVVAVQALQT